MLRSTQIRCGLLLFGLFTTFIIGKSCLFNPFWSSGVYERGFAQLNSTESFQMGDGFHSANITGDPVSLAHDDGVKRFLTQGDTMGKLVSPWFKFSETAILQVAGMLREPANNLVVEIRHKNDSVYTLQFNGKSSAVRWLPWRISHGRDDVALRFIATDGSTETWIGVSRPYAYEPLFSIAQLVVTALVAIFLLLGTGLLIRHCLVQKRETLINPAWSVLPGILIAAALGVVIWFRPLNIPAYQIAAPAIICWMWILIVIEWKSSWFTELDTEHRGIILLVLIVTAAAAGRGFYSAGPYDELYSHSISRSTETGFTSDSRISYHNVQLTLKGWDISDPRGRKLFDPFYFTTRGPLAGWVSSGFVGMLRPHIPEVWPDQPWEPFDPYGFGAFRVTMTVLSSLLVVVVFGLLTLFTLPSNAFFGTLFLATSPFFIHECFFTWPKLACVSMIFLAAVAVTEGGIILAGMMMGLAYLFHPMAMLLMPFPGLWRIALDYKVLSESSIVERRQFWLSYIKQCLWRFCPYIAGIGLICLPWILINRNDYHQSSFFSYIMNKAHAATWVGSRISSALNTLVPFYQFFIWPIDYRMSSPGTTSPGSVRWLWQYWSTLPMGLGLTLFPVIYGHFFAMIRKHFWVLFLTFILPFTVHWLCFGFELNGLTRNSGHVMVFSLILTFCWSLTQTQTNKGTIRLAKPYRWCLKWRCLELFYVLFGFALWPNYRLVNHTFWEADLYVFASALLSLMTLHVIWRRHVIARLVD